MHAVGWAFAWDMWGRYRRLTALTLAYLLVLVLLVNAFPAGSFDPGTVVRLTMPLWFLGPLLLGVGSLAEHADLAVRESGYPRRLLTRPLRTLELVAWPLSLGAAAVAGYWLVLGGLVLRPADLPVPVLWPAVFAAALLTWTQALIWFPFPLPFLRLIVALPVLGALIVGAMLGLAGDVSPALLLAVYAGLIPPGYLVAVVGVARARRGDTPVWSWLPFRQRARGAAAAPWRPFASPAAALFWLEWRRNGYLLPLMVGLVLLPLLPLQALVGDPRDADWQAGVFLVCVVVFPPLLAGVAGASLGNGHPWSRQVSLLPAFIAARPVTSAELIAVKLRVAARATLVTWVLVVLAILAILPFSPAGAVLIRGTGRLIETQGVQGGVLLLLIVLGLVALTAKAFLNQLWIGLTGRTWVLLAVTLAFIAGMTAVGLVGDWVAPRPEAQAALLDAVPWVIVLVLALKLGAGLLVARALLRRGLVPPRTLARCAVAWVVAAGALFGLAFWLTPPEVYSPPVVGCAAVVLGLPLVRLGLAPLALDWNRHR
jgi:hypothetical protein